MYHALKSKSGKINYQELSKMYHALKSKSGKINYQDATSRVVGPFSIFVGAYTVISNASDDQLRVTKEQLSHLKAVRKLLDPEGYGLVVEKPEQTLMGRALLWLQQHKSQQHKKSGSGDLSFLNPAMSFLKPTEISAEEWAEIMFNSFNPF